MEMGKRKKRQRENEYPWALVITTAAIFATVIVGIIVFRFYMRGFKEETENKTYSRYYVMITEDRKSSFWQSVYRGAFERGQEEDVYVDMLGDNLSESYTREEMMRIAISSHVDGIIVAADESGRMTSLIDEAVQEGIPVVTCYNDNSHGKRCSFVGVGNYNLGKEYGRQVLKILEEENYDANVMVVDQVTDTATSVYFDRRSPVKIVVLASAYVQDPGKIILFSTIQETIKMEGGANVKVELSQVSINDSNAFAAEEAIRDLFMEEEIPDIIICLNELNTTCAYQAVVDYNKVGQVSILGYYDSDTIIKAIDRNVIYATASIDTEQMGKFCVDALTEYNELGYTSQYFTTDVKIIDKDNVSDYLGGDEDDTEAP